MPFSQTLLWDVFCRVIDNHGDLGVCWRLARELAARGQRVRLWVDDASALRWMAPEALAGTVPGVQLRPWSDAEQGAALVQPGACRTWGVESENRPQRDQFLPDLQSSSPAIGQKDGEKWAAAVGSQPTIRKSDRLLELADVWIEAFACELPSAFVAAGVAATAVGQPPPVWINLEYLSAEDWVLRTHGLPSPVLRGPAAGWTKWFFHPGLQPGTAGVLREHDLSRRQQAFRRSDWLTAHGASWQGEPPVSLFCYEPPALRSWLAQLAAGQKPTRVLVTAGRARLAVAQALGLVDLPGDGGEYEQGHLRLVFLPYLSQPAFDELLWACDLNLVRGEDSLVRALWAGKPWVWQPYVQDDDAHHAKLEALLQWANWPDSWQAFHRVWSGIDAGPLPVLSQSAWIEIEKVARQLRERLQQQDELLQKLQQWVLEKR